MADTEQNTTLDHSATQDTPAARDDVAREPVKSPESIASEAKASDDQNNEHRSFLGRIKDRYTAQMKVWRHKAIEATPGFIVNNSSNVLGAAHVGTEMMMFKSGMPEGTKLVKNPSNPVSWLVDPLKTVYSETFHAARAENIGDLFKGNVAKNVWNRVSDMEAAAERYRQRPEFKGKLGNPWQFRTTGMGLVAWTMSALIPEKKESDQEIERMAIKGRMNPVGYVGERLKQAVWVPGWGEHKRQMMGLSYLVIGTASAIGSWRGRTGGGSKYTFNPAYLATSVISFVSGLPLLFANDEQRAYGTFGNLMLLRIPFLFKSIHQKYTDLDSGRHMYTASSVTFQLENSAFTLIGGAEKKTMPDGTVKITDHEAIREEAKQKAILLKAGKIHDRNKDGIIDEPAGAKQEVPNLVVAGRGLVEKAMPDRVAQQAEQVIGA